MSKKTCKRCGERKEISLFPKHGGLLCKKCKSAVGGERKRSPDFVPPFGFVERRVLTGMKSRCYNKNESNYKNYGGKEENPTTICKEWLESSDQFIKDMGLRPEGKDENGRSLYSIERKDPDGNYDPENCYWATREEQSNNKTTTLKVSVEGEEIPATLAARKHGLNPATLRKRATRSNLTGTDLIAPVPEIETFPYKGEMLSVTDLAKIAGVYQGTMHYRVKVLGMDPVEAVNKPKDNRGSWKRNIKPATE